MILQFNCLDQNKNDAEYVSYIKYNICNIKKYNVLNYIYFNVFIYNFFDVSFIIYE